MQYTLNRHIQSITAFAPATCANVAVGFDILGFAFNAVGDHVTLTHRSDDEIVIEEIIATESLPTDPEKNTASFVIQKLCADLQLNSGFSLKIKKGIPMSSGMGGSAASAVAALVALNAFLTPQLPLLELARYALLGEALVSGQAHADNIVPCLFGGFTLIQSTNPMHVVQLPLPNLFTVLVHPHLCVTTESARKILKPELPLTDYVKQSANLAAFIAGLYQGNIHLLKHTLDDVLIESQRAQFVPGFYDIKQAALEAGALGASFSGSGPSLFAFAETRKEAEHIADKMGEACKKNGLTYDTWIDKMSKKAACVTQLF